MDLIPFSTITATTTRGTMKIRHTIPYLEIRNIRSQFDNLSSKFVPWNDRKLDHWELPAPIEDIAVTNSTSPNTDQSLARPGFLQLPISVLKLLRPTTLFKNNSFHYLRLYKSPH
jgi:hypothetical protein